MRKMIFQSVTHGVQSSLLWLSGRASRVATRQGSVPERPISPNPGLSFCSVFVFYLPLYFLE